MDIGRAYNASDAAAILGITPYVLNERVREGLLKPVFENGDRRYSGYALVLQRRVVIQGNSWADFEAGNERVRVSHDERSVAEEEDLSVFSHNSSL